MGTNLSRQAINPNRFYFYNSSSSKSYPKTVISITDEIAKRDVNWLCLPIFLFCLKAQKVMSQQLVQELVLLRWGDFR